MSKLGEMSREIRSLDEKIRGFDDAFAVGVKMFRKARWLVAVCYLAFFCLLGVILSDYPFVVFVGSGVITFLGFWFLPALVFHPICQSIALRYFSSEAKLIFGTSVQSFQPDFVRRTFVECDVWKTDKSQLDKALVDFRQRT